MNNHRRFWNKVFAWVAIISMMGQLLMPLIPSGTAHAAPLADVTDYEARWQLDGDATDAVGTHNGTERNFSSPTYVTGQSGQAADLNGSNEDIQVPASADLEPFTENFTLSAWVKTSDANGQIIYRMQNKDYYSLRVEGGKAVFSFNQREF